MVTADGNEAVIADGLVPGMQVVSTGVHVLTPGQKVRILSKNRLQGNPVKRNQLQNGSAHARCGGFCRRRPGERTMKQAPQNTGFNLRPGPINHAR